MLAIVKRVWRDYVLKRSALWWYAAVLSLFILSAVSIAVWRHQVPAGTLRCKDIVDLRAFTTALVQHQEPLSDFLWNGISETLRKRLAAQEFDSGETHELAQELVKELNAILRGNCIYASNRFHRVELSLESRELLAGRMEGDEMELNRYLLQDAYRKYIKTYRARWDTSDRKGKHSLGITPGPLYQVALFAIGFFVGAFCWESWKRCNNHCSEGLYYAIKRVLVGKMHGVAKKNGSVDASSPCNVRWRRFCDGALGMLQDRSIARDLVSIIFFALVAAVASTVPILFLSDGLGFLEFTENVALNPGGIFALVTGVATLVGTVVAIQAILEVRQTITSFPQLMSRLTAMIKEDSTADGEILFLAYTPLTGAWNADRKFAEKLKKALCDHTKYVKLACLEPGAGKDHERFLNLFLKREARSRYPLSGPGTIDETVIHDYVRKCDEVFGVLEQKAPNEETGYHKHKDFKGALIPLADKQMPGYYFFVSSKRAIIVVPVGMPTISHPNTSRDRVVHVETLGFETTDSRIISALRQEFDRYTEPNSDDMSNASDHKLNEAPFRHSGLQVSMNDTSNASVSSAETSINQSRPEAQGHTGIPKSVVSTLPDAKSSN